MRASVTILVALWMLFTAVPPAAADYARARIRFQSLSIGDQQDIAFALIATGDFEGIARHGFTRVLYRAILHFETREGFRADGVLGSQERLRLEQSARRFYARLGNRFYTHPETGARLLIPRKLFDDEKTTPEGLLFSRKDEMLSLIFLSFTTREKSFDTLWRTLTSEHDGKRITYKRRFDTHFVSTGIFMGRKFYTWMARTDGSSTGFTLSWSDEWEETGRKLATLLANAFFANPQP